MAGMGSISSGSGDPKDDILARGPMNPALKNARPGSASGASNNDSGARAMAILGANPTTVIMNGVATVEQTLKMLAMKSPAIAQIADPFIAQLRDIAAASMADLNNGGLGTAQMGAGAPPAAGAPPPGAGAGPAGMMPPPPM